MRCMPGLRRDELMVRTRAECELAAITCDMARELRAETADRIAESRRVRGRLRRERHGSRSSEGASERGKDRQVGVQPNPIRSTDAERDSARSFLSRPNSRSTAARRRKSAVHRGVSRGISGCRRSAVTQPQAARRLPGRAAPLARAALAVRPGEPPLAMLTQRRAMVAARRTDGPANAMIGRTSRASHPSHARALVVRSEQAQRHHQVCVQAGTDGAQTVSNPPRARRAPRSARSCTALPRMEQSSPTAASLSRRAPRAGSSGPPPQTAVHPGSTPPLADPRQTLPGLNRPYSHVRT
jgi:hypothetical protein